MKKTLKKNVTIDELAVMVANGFDAISAKFDSKLDDKFASLDKKIDEVEERLSGKINGLECRIDDVALNRATKDEVYALALRVSKIEKKVKM